MAKRFISTTRLGTILVIVAEVCIWYPSRAPAQHESRPIAPSQPVAVSPNAASSTPGAQCSAKEYVYRNEAYKYDLCIPNDWKADLGDDPRDPGIALGPRDHFRPLILVQVYTDPSRYSQDRSIADDAVVNRRTRQVAGLEAEQLTLSLPQTILEEVILQHGAIHFIITQWMGLEEEHVDEVFDRMLSTFRLN
jgi:hypothetical protein